MNRRLAHFLACACLAAPLTHAQTLFGIGVTASTLGVGAQAAVSVTKYSNLRAGFNAFNYSDTFSKDGVAYSGTLSLRSVQVTWDQYFPHLGGFHISPGALIYDGNAATGNASVPGGQSFTLGGTTYYSSSANPIAGTGSLTVAKAAPMVLVGFGNLLPRSSRHFGISAEAGVVFQGSASARLNLTGSACLDVTQTACRNAATDPSVQSNVQAEQTKLNNDISPFRFYPVVALGFSFKF